MRAEVMLVADFGSTPEDPPHPAFFAEGPLDRPSHRDVQELARIKPRRGSQDQRVDATAVHPRGDALSASAGR